MGGAPEPEVKETRAAKKARIAAEKAKENDAKIEEELKGWNPKEDPKLADSDPYPLRGQAELRRRRG